MEQEVPKEAAGVGSEPGVVGAEVASLREKLALAVAKYRTLLLASAPEVPQELVQGETVEAVDASFVAARKIVEGVRQRLEAQRLQERVPAGAPERRGLDLSALSPKDKIARALGRG